MARREHGNNNLADGDLFSNAVVDSYVKDRRFVARQWLVDRVEAAWSEETARFVLLTGEPGSGKSALMADLWHCSTRRRRHEPRAQTI